MRKLLGLRAFRAPFARRARIEGFRWGVNVEAQDFVGLKRSTALALGRQ